MPFYPTIPEIKQTQVITNTFLGYNRNLEVGEGSNNVKPVSGLEFYDMTNLTSSFYPLLANRGKRGTVSQLTEPSALVGKSQLAYIDGANIYYGELNLTSYLTAKGVAISTSSSMLPKQLVSMGAYIVILPDKLYINTENYTDCGSIESTFSTVENADVSYTICKDDGTAYDVTSVGSTEPASPTNGTLWIDTSEAKHTLKQWNSSTNMWVSIATVYVKITYTGIGTNFEKYDGVTISGCATTDTTISEQIESLNGSKIIYDRGTDYIVVIGLLDHTYTQSSGVVTVSRKMPDIDYITEAENRLWGCKYGLVNGETVNEIYACALGDFKNWNKFLGISTDSYAASVGTDGKWTGAVTHNGYPIFFKENHLHKVYISSTGAHQIVDAACRGVQDGCSKSLVVVNETLFFKSRVGICAYDGSMPASVSSDFGTDKYSDAVAGAIENKYYVSMKDSSNNWHMFVYDVSKGLWHREDATHALMFAKCGDELYFIDSANKLIAVNGSVGTAESYISWSATTNIIGYNTTEQKYVSRFNLRMQLPVGSNTDLYIQYDSDGTWHHQGHIEGTGTTTFMIPVRPRRCDHFAIRIEGTGNVRIYSIAKILEVGSDG